ncbi:MAG: dTMP kinase, partial [Xanthobacteraceae bacterium]
MTTPSAETGAAARGRFITFEGGEGSGKSTQIQMLAERLDRAGVRVIVTREPGGSPGAEIIRHVLLSGVGKALGADAETLLFAAARDDHVRSVIEPALKQNVWVLCDRFIDSTRVYQGHAAGVDRRLVEALERVTIGTLKPDLTFVLDLPVEVGMRRAAQRRGNEVPDRFEGEALGFHEKLRDGFRRIAAAEPERCVLIDAMAPPEQVARAIWQALGRRGLV